MYLFWFATSSYQCRTKLHLSNVSGVLPLSHYGGKRWKGAARVLLRPLIDIRFYCRDLWQCCGVIKWLGSILEWKDQYRHHNEK